jgi:membrane protein implicated in regulation of membrane protease activity
LVLLAALAILVPSLLVLFPALLVILLPALVLLLPLLALPGLVLLLIVTLVIAVLPVFRLGQAAIGTQGRHADHRRERNPSRRLSNTHHEVPPDLASGKVPAMGAIFPCDG